MKILIFATSPNQNIGYSKVGNYISNYLASISDNEVIYFAVHNVKDKIVDRFIDPKIQIIDVDMIENERKLKNDYGMEIIEEFLNKIKPDIFFIYNDIIVTCRLFNQLLNFREKFRDTVKFVSYIDLVYPYEKLRYIQHLDRNTDLIFVFSDSWKENLVNCGIDSNKIKIFYHGLDDSIIFKTSKSFARKQLGISEDDFVILNTNRNCYRKANEVTIKAFIHFFVSEKQNPKLKLLLNMYLDAKIGYDLLNEIQVECLRYKIKFETIEKQIIILQNGGAVSDSLINLMYNASDIGINTAIGEGFGLCNFEHAMLGVPQVVANVGGLKDIFKNEYAYIVEPLVTVSASNLIDDHNGDLQYSSHLDFAKGMKFYFYNRDKLEEHGKLGENVLKSKYNLKTLLPRFYDDLKSFLKPLKSSEKILPENKSKKQPLSYISYMKKLHSS
jgi:hypothetical protein